VIGIVADDLTGAADVAGILARSGVQTSLLVGPPLPGRPLPAADAVVVGLRIRTAQVPQAVRLASLAAAVLLNARPGVLAWKICSTFDSTPEGNIGPVADALLGLSGLPIAVVCPAFPENGRTVEDGRLLVHGVPLDESSMRDHPLTPMRDADLVRLLAPQVAEPARVGRLPTMNGADGLPAIAAAIDVAVGAGVRYAIADAVTAEDVDALGEAVVGRALPVMASGLAPGLVAGLRSRGLLPPPVEPTPVDPLDSPALLVAGSCSVATRGQVSTFATHHPVVRLDPTAPDPAATAISGARALYASGERAVLVSSSDDPAGVERARAALGDAAGARIEGWLGEVAATLARDGIRRVIVAGGETSGVVLEALGVGELRLGPELTPGVPVLERIHDPRMLLVAKSGNFGGPDLFCRALAVTGPRTECLHDA